jgi:hypothetical protein
MTIEERIEHLGAYFHSMNVAAENNIIYVRVKFPKGWGFSELTSYNFNVTSVADEIPGYFYFFANIEIGFDKIFDAIEFNIKFNEDAQAKVSLLKEKIEELKNIFETEEISVLKTLEFKVKKKSVKRSKNKVIEDALSEKEDIVKSNEEAKSLYESISSEGNEYQIEKGTDCGELVDTKYNTLENTI